MHVSLELMVQIKQQGEYGVETPLPRSFLGGIREVYGGVGSKRFLSPKKLARA